MFREMTKSTVWCIPPFFQISESTQDPSIQVFLFSCVLCLIKIPLTVRCSPSPSNIYSSLPSHLSGFLELLLSHSGRVSVSLVTQLESTLLVRVGIAKLLSDYLCYLHTYLTMLSWTGLCNVVTLGLCEISTCFCLSKFRQNNGY